MSFWATSDGSSAQSSDGKFEAGGVDLAPIPEDTSVLATAEEAKNSEYQGDEYLNIKWRVAKPAEYANRVIFQKVRVYDKDPSKADKAKKMLGAIAANAGGGLFTAMEQRKEAKPSDQSLAQLCNRPMVLKLGIWELEDKSKNGNWVKAVSPAKGSAAATVAAQPAPVAKPKPAPVADSDEEFEIPF